MKKICNGDNLEHLIVRNFPAKLVKLVREIGFFADEKCIDVFLVGGFVRDLILGRPNYDLDIVVEGNAIHFAKEFAEKTGGALVVHHRFGTATIVKNWPAWLGKCGNVDGKFKIDIATARKEIYDMPAALPQVEPSIIKNDLYRRDFTINAMAVKINSCSFGMFIDHFNGTGDLARGVIRALHDKSFIDDPTRIFRAVRFEQRLGFKIDKHTEALILGAVKERMFDRTENQRIRTELLLMMKEAHPEKSVKRMLQLHELEFIHPGIKISGRTAGLYNDARKCLKWYNVHVRKDIEVWLVNFLILLDGLDLENAVKVTEKFVFPSKTRSALRALKGDSQEREDLAQQHFLSASRIYEILKPMPDEAIIALMATCYGNAKASNRIKKYLTKYSRTTLGINGSDICKLGVGEGPHCGTLLKKVLYAKLDGKVRTRSQELDLVKNLMNRKG